MKINRNDIKWYYINLATRQDRMQHVISELNRVRITAERFNACSANDFDFGWNFQRHSPAQKGCSLSHITLMKLFNGNLGKHLGIFEDDVFFCDDFQERFQYIEEKFDKPWDIFYLDSFYHLNDYPRKHHQIEYELTDIDYIHRVYSHFCCHSYIINKDSIDKILTLYQQNIAYTWAIDSLQILIEPQLNCYAFTPGMCGQLTNKSDIQGRVADQMSVFYKECGKHIFVDRLENFDYQNYFKKELL